MRSHLLQVLKGNSLSRIKKNAVAVSIHFINQNQRLQSEKETESIRPTVLIDRHHQP